MNRLTGRGTSLLYSPVVPQLKKKTLNSVPALQDSYLSTKLFENHTVVFTVGISIASVSTCYGLGWLFFRPDQVDMTKTDTAVQTLADINPDVVLEASNELSQTWMESGNL